MSDLDAHLLAILADPASTLARMTFADRLDDDGQAERAEFIRLQAGLLPGAKCADRCTGKRDANVRCSTCGPIKERIRALAFAATPCWHGFDRLTAATCLQCASTELHNRVGGYDTLTNAAADWLGFAVSNPADTRPIQWWWTRGFVGRVRMTWAAECERRAAILNDRFRTVVHACRNKGMAIPEWDDFPPPGSAPHPALPPGGKS